MISATEALARLREGNARFVAGTSTLGRLLGAERREALLSGQAPSTIVLGCSDSRVPAEIVFDQGPGEIFVIRVAGNIVAPSQIGSIEFAAEQFGTRLVVVLGHEQCGAVRATLDQLATSVELRSPHLRRIVDFIRPSVEPVFLDTAGNDPEAAMERAIRANVRGSVEQLHHGSEILKELIADEGLIIVGAEYSLQTGVVEFFDDA